MTLLTTAYSMTVLAALQFQDDGRKVQRKRERERKMERQPETSRWNEGGTVAVP